MKKALHTLIVLAALCVAGITGVHSPRLSAQNYQGGVVVSASDFGPLDMLSLTQFNSTLTTARATAMGGAFTALGGDFASMSINPAGVGMFSANMVGISPAMNFSGSDNSFSHGTVNKNRFSFNNIGAVTNTYFGSGAVTAFNIGFSYNKLADFNYDYRMDMPQGAYSIADLMSYHLNGLYMFLGGNGWDGLPLNMLQNNPFGNASLSEWGAVLGYQTGILGSTNPSDDQWALYSVNGLVNGAEVLPEMRVSNRGSVGEYNLTGGMNIGNELYLGLGISFQDIYLARTIGYYESYVNNTGDNPDRNYLRSLSYDQSVRMSGFGMNFKLGAIYRPIPELRIGVAVHTPTWSTVTHEYFASMQADFTSDRSVERESLLNYYDMSYSSPTRLMAGVSYTLGTWAAVSFDYERVWNNGMRLSGDEDEYVKDGYKDEIKALYKPSDNFKAGIEVKPIPEISLRAGFSYYGNSLSGGDDFRYAKPVIDNTRNISAGIGFRLGYDTMLDLAYVYSVDNYCPFDIFYYEGELLNGAGEIINTHDSNDPITTSGGPITDMRVKRHTAVMSLSFLF